MSTSRCILLDHTRIGDQHIPSFVHSIRLVLQSYEHVTLHTPRSYPHWDQHIPSSHQISVLWHDSRITSKITNKSMYRECWVHFMHSTTNALCDVEAVELSVLVVGIPHWSQPLIQSEDSMEVRVFNVTTQVWCSILKTKCWYVYLILQPGTRVL
jgi:hypothetical protein